VSVIDPATPWYERWPELEAWELGRFRARGLPAEFDAERRAAGQLVVTTSVRFGGNEVPLRVKYPSEYPELPPQVDGPPGLVKRHQHLFSGNFCLLERVLDDWKAREWGAADLIAEQLTRLLADTEAGPEVVAKAEAPMPEPVSTYFGYANDVAVLIPGEFAVPSGDTGEMKIARATPHLFVVEEVDGKRASDALQEAIAPYERLAGRWLRLDRAPARGSGDGPSVAEWLRDHSPSVLARSIPPKLAGSRRIPTPPPLELVGITFPEEGPGVGESRAGWMFLLIDRTEARIREFLLHAQVVSPEERQRRIPELDGLPERRVVVCGLGSVGGDVALELARAGVGILELVDFDRFEANNTVRHPLGIEYAGQPKSQAVALACRRANPFCEAKPHNLRFGEAVWETGDAPLGRLADLLEDADLVVEATGSHQIGQFLSRIAWDAGVPLVAGWMTDGAYGAELVRIQPYETSCWTCFATKLREGQLPTAERGPETQVVVQGCSHPTTAGAGFDAAETAAMLVRLGIGALKPAGGYQDSDWDYAALSFRRAPNDPQQPRMAVAALTPNEECVLCGPGAGSTQAR
jgi:molybdopterin/thiamine biosynthesis adenylyltransferase